MTTDQPPASGQPDRARAFRALHGGPLPLVLPNAWDAGSARLLAQSGAAAIGTTSAGMAFSHGRRDTALDPEAVLAGLAAICAAVDLPVTADIEAGYADNPDGVAETVRKAIAAGAVGINLEDGTGNPDEPLEPVEIMVARLQAARAAIRESDVAVFLNARTDGFWAGGRGEEVLAGAITRGQAYAAAGADGVFIPLLTDRTGIARAVSAIGVPVNLLAHPALPPLDELAALGVRRISTGGGLARLALKALQDGWLKVSDGEFGVLGTAIPHAEMQRRFRRT